MNIGELAIALSFNSDMTALTTMNSSLNTGQKMAMGLKNAVLGLSYGLDNLVKSALQSAVDLQTFANQTGIAIQQAQQWQYVANLNNVSFQGLKGSILGIQQAQANLMIGTGNMRPWALLGIDPRQDPFAVIQKLRTAIKGLPSGIAMGLITQMGLSPEMINILKAGTLEFDKLSKKFMLTAKEQQNLMGLNRVVKDLGFSIKGMMERLVAVNFEPLMRFFKAIKNSISITFDMLKYLSELIQHSKKLQTGLIGLGAVLGVISLINPFMRWGAIILGIILLLDDLYVYIKGGKSVIGDLMNAFEKTSIGKSFKNLFKTFKDLKDTLKNSELSKTIKDIFEKINWEKIGKIFKESFVFVIQMAAEAMTVFLKSLIFFINIIDKLQTKGIKGLLKDENFKKDIENIGEFFKYSMVGINNPNLDTAMQSNISNYKNTTSTNTNINQDIKIQVDGAKNPKETGKEIKGTLNKQLDKAVYGR